MFIPVTGAMIGAVQGVLHEINVEENTIRQIVEILESSSDVVGAHKPGEVAPGVFGGSWSGESLGYHTSLAHAHVVGAMDQMVKTLMGAGERVRAYHDEITFYDDDSADRSRGSLNRHGGPGAPAQPALYRPPTSPAGTAGEPTTQEA